eukprot:1493366-Amphidinium_carterae.1
MEQNATRVWCTSPINLLLFTALDVWQLFLEMSSKILMRCMFLCHADRLIPSSWDWLNWLATVLGRLGTA